MCVILNVLHQTCSVLFEGVSQWDFFFLQPQHKLLKKQERETIQTNRPMHVMIGGRGGEGGCMQNLGVSYKSTEHSNQGSIIN